MATFPIPPGAVAEVSIIDSGVRLNHLKTAFLLTPEVPGFQVFPPLASYSFYVQSSTGKKVLFDLGFPVDLAHCPPIIRSQLDQLGCVITGDKTVPHVLREGGVQLEQVDSIIWSHQHWDHTGDIRAFPLSTEVVVGPGFSAAYLPGYPSISDSHLDETYTKDRHVREISFSDSDSITIGQFRAHDFFGDGSLYLLDTPGHTIGHLAGLARTSSDPDTFILMGGDLSHHAGELRPTTSMRIPDDLKTQLGESLPPSLHCCLGGQAFRRLHTRSNRKPGDAFFDAALVEDEGAAALTINGTKDFDSREDVFVVLAHDMAIRDAVDVFPKSANGWKQKGWKDMTQWRFLSDLAVAAAGGDDLDK